jgi:putative (di)nucleoside polyphosphate hydrolase
MATRRKLNAKMFEKTPSNWSSSRFRAGVAVLLKAPMGQYVTCQRADGSGWQCVQGGLDNEDKDLYAAAVRETQEELGVRPENLKILKRSEIWRRYHFPEQVLAKGGIFVGQDQMWFLGQIDNETSIQLARSCGEFSSYELVSLEELLARTVAWKRPLLADFCRELERNK